MRACAAVIGLTLAGLAPAYGSGGFWCSGDDKDVRFSIGAGLNRGSGALFNLRGELQVLLSAVPADLRRLTLERADLIQHWLDQRELKLLVARERYDRPFASLRLLVETRRTGTDDEGAYSGSYALTLSLMKSEQDGEPTVLEMSGSASCSSD